MPDKLDAGTCAAVPPSPKWPAKLTAVALVLNRLLRGREQGRQGIGGGKAPTEGESPAPSSPTAPLPWRLSRLESWPALLTIVGFVLYAVVRIAQENYAGSLGIRPDDLGLNYSSSLVGAAALAGLLAVMLLFAVVAASTPIVFIIWHLKVFNPVSRWWFSGVPVIVLLVFTIGWGPVVAVTAASFTRLLVFPHVDWAFFGSVVLFLVLVPGIASLLTVGRVWTWGTGKEPPELAQKLRRFRVFILIALVAPALLYLAGQEGSSAAERVQDGKPTTSSLYSIRVEAVTVIGSLPRGFTPPARVMLLATSDQRLTLYDPDHKQFILLPADGALVVQKKEE